MNERWEDVRVTIVRPEVIDQQGPCANTIPQDDLKAFSLPSGECSRNHSLWTSLLVLSGDLLTPSQFNTSE